jgi:hypothetical protein
MCSIAICYDMLPQEGPSPGLSKAVPLNPHNGKPNQSVCLIKFACLKHFIVVT